MVDGPVVESSEVRVLLTKELKTAAGLTAAEYIKEARLRDVATTHSRENDRLLSFGRGFGRGIISATIATTASKAVTQPVTRLRSVGTRLRSVGHRDKCQTLGKCD